MTTTTAKPRQSRAARGAAKAAEASNVTPITAHSETRTGRVAAGDRRPAPKPAAKTPASKPASKPPAPAKAKPAVMGPSGYRAKHCVGTSEAKILAAVRAHGEEEQWPTLTDAQLLDAIGWSLTAARAIQKTRAYLEARQGK
jgi:hypothetical protein